MKPVTSIGAALRSRHHPSGVEVKPAHHMTG
eukprot:CAMPEP_0182592704 /NCGR_PEP_ID=MMETSP1324-20130603/76470_1 /TAXON_ID=236786 /ORGANISM="Florenciella sp., Strain RCC1587" /LENGTH=30 /DNA_ID= /DNA_START= /DNA_END= /DNA_ORIENTATION=